MKITIDTSTESHEQIRKAIQLLQSLVGEQSVYTNAPQEQKNIFNESQPAVGNLFSMFDSADKQEQTTVAAPPPVKKVPQLEFY
jgi:hypothetical protein